MAVGVAYFAHAIRDGMNMKMGFRERGKRIRKKYDDAVAIKYAISLASVAEA